MNCLIRVGALDKIGQVDNSQHNTTLNAGFWNNELNTRMSIGYQPFQLNPSDQFTGGLL